QIKSSPRCTGWRNVIESIAIVTQGMRAWRIAQMAPASSTMRRITPPWTLPCALACSGSISWCKTRRDWVGGFAEGGLSDMPREAYQGARARLGRRSRAEAPSKRTARAAGAHAPMDFVYFIVLVSSLILVHEFGHFLFAKVFGVKVLTFSLGFGPKIIKLQLSET